MDSGQRIAGGGDGSWEPGAGSLKLGAGSWPKQKRGRESRRGKAENLKRK